MPHTGFYGMIACCNQSGEKLIFSHNDDNKLSLYLNRHVAQDCAFNFYSSVFIFELFICYLLIAALNAGFRHLEMDTKTQMFNLILHIHQ